MDESLNVPLIPQVVDSARRQADQQLDQVSRPRRIQIDFDEKNYVRKLGAITGQADEFSKSMEAANARVLAFGASVGVINTISNAFKNLVTSTIEVEKSLTEIKLIGNETFKDLGKTSSGIFGAAKQLGVSYKDAAASTLEFARQGKGLAESLDASRAALALTRTAGIAATEAVMGLTSAVNAFGRGADAYIEYANKMSAVSDAFAVNNKDLIEGLSRSASVAQEAGVSFEELTALITTLQEKTGRGGAVIGNALKTIFTRVQNPEILKDLRDLGISVQDDITGNFLPATQIIKNLANEFQSFDKNLRNTTLLKVGGGFQVDKLAALLNDVKSATGTFQKSFDIATSGGGNILAKVAELNKTIDSSLTNISTSAKQLASNIGQIAFSKDFVKILETGSSALNSLNEAIFGDGSSEDNGSNFAKGILKGIGSVFTGPGLALFAGILGKLVIDFGKFSTSGVQTLLGITSKTKEEELIQKSITTLLANNVDFQTKLFSLENNKVEQARLLLSVYKQQADQVQKISSLSQDLAPTMYESGVRLSGGTPKVTAASGYIPNLASAIAKEKAESPAGSRIIVDRNFPMGGGQRSTMVYNSNETRIRNFAGTGGDAIIPNYPINSAKGFTPNFAEPKRKVLDIDASRASVAGLTFAGEQKNSGVLDKTKPVTIDDDLLEKYSGSPFLGILKQFEALKLVNLPVGNVYKFRKGLQGDEKEIKKDFIDKLNLKFRDQIISFLKEEISGLGLASGGGLDENLSKLKLNVIGPSTAGYIFEEILKIPTLTNAEKVAQYANQSDTDFFDIRGLKANFAEAYGLPKRDFDLAEIKFGQKELFDGVSKKFLNEVIFQGGGADPKKFGVKDSNRAARGYIPNFAENQEEIKQKKLLKFKQGSDLENELFKKLNLPPAGNRALDFPKGVLDRYSQDEKSKLDINSLTKWGDLKLSFNRKNSISLLSKFLREKNSKIRGSKNDIYNIDEVNSGFAMLYKNGDQDQIQEIKDISLSSLVEKNPSLYEILGPQLASGQKLTEKGLKTKFNFKFFGDRISLNAANGYIPNFSELTGTGAGMLYQDPNFNELGGGQSGKFLAPKSGEGFGQKIFYKLGSDKINQEYQVNKSIKDFEKQNPALFAKNAISFTNVGKILTKNGLDAGFEREVIGGLSVDDFATQNFITKPGQPTPKANFAFFLSELLAQTGVKNVVGEYRKIYGPDSLRIDDIYAQNFKVNDIMQKMLIEETNQFFKGKKKVTDSEVDNYIRSLNGNPLVNSLNEKFGAAGGRHTMFDTQGFAKSASKGYIPNFARMTADLLTVSPNVATMSVDQFIEKYLGSEYSTGLSGTSANSTKITGNAQQRAEAKRDFIMSMLGPNFLATYERNDKANESRRALINAKSTSTGTRVKTEGGYLRAYGKYAQPDLSAALEGVFSGEAKRLTYEELDKKAEKIFEENNLTQYWNQIVRTMELVGQAYVGEAIMANNTGTKMDFDYNTVQVGEPGDYSSYGFLNKYKAKDKIKQLTGLIRPKLIEGLLEGQKGVQGLVLNQPEYDKGSVQGDYFVLLDPKAAQLKKLVSNYLINPDLDPLELGSTEQFENKFRIKEILNTLDGVFGYTGGKGIFLDTLKTYRKYSEGNPQLQKFFMDGEDRPGAFIVNKTLNQKTREASNKLGAFLKPNFPKEILERISTVLAASYNRDGIFQLSNLDVGYKGQLSYEGYKSNPLIDTFATSPELPNQPSAASIPSSVRYGDYKNNKAYYDSIAKWKYDPASKSMIRQAAHGYIPNFAGGAISDAIMREKMQSGLPSSQISLTQDSRLVNNLNPSGFAVINKRDEPNGKVPTNRISDAYKNASRGFIPNFTNQLAAVRESIIRERATITPEANAALSSGTQATVQTTNAQKKLSEQIFDYLSSLNLSTKAQDKALSSLLRFESILDDSSKLTRERLKVIFNSLSTNLGLAGSERSGLYGQLGLRTELTTQSTTQQATTSTNTPAESQSGQQKPDEKEEKSKKDTTKSFGDLALSAFKFQSVLSATSGFLSAFGKDAEKAGELINTLGQGAYAATQGLEVIKTISGGKDLTSILKTIGPSFKEGFASKEGSSLLSRIFAGGKSVIGTAATSTTAATGLGGGLVGVGSLLAPVAALAAGAFLGGKAIDQFSKIVTGSSGRTEKALSTFNSLQEKYNAQLSEAGRSRVSKLADRADVSGSGFSGLLNEFGVGLGGSTFRLLRAAVGGKDYTYKDRITEALGASKLNLDNEGNKALAELFGPLLDPIAVENTAKFIKGKRYEGSLSEQNKELGERFVDILEEIDKEIGIASQELLEKRGAEIAKTLTRESYQVKKLLDDKSITRIMTETGKEDTTQTVRSAGLFLAKQQYDEKKLKEDANAVAVSKVFERLTPKSEEAKARNDSEKQGILIRTELLKKELEVNQQIQKIRSSIPSSLESSLSIQKELNSTSESEKFALDLKLKQLQEERQLRLDIKDIFSNEAKSTLSENLSKTAALGIPIERAENIKKLFDQLQKAPDLESQRKAYQDIVKDLNLAVSFSEKRRQELEKEINVLDNQLKLNGKNNDERTKALEKQEQTKKQLESSKNLLEQLLKSTGFSVTLAEEEYEKRVKINAQQALERAIIDRNNYYFNLRKEMLSSMFEKQNKLLQQRREELSLAKETRDVEFQRSQFLNAPQKTQAQSEYEAAINSARENRRTALENLSQRQKEVALQNRQALFGEISSRAGNDINLLERAANTKDQGELQKILEDAVIKQGGTFEDKVISAAKEFYRIINKAAVDSKAGTADQSIINEAESAKNIEKKLAEVGSVGGVQSRIDEIKKIPDYQKNTELTDEIKRLEDAISKAKSYAKAKVDALTVKGPDEQKTKRNIDTRFATEKEMAELEKYKKEGFGGGLMTAYDEMKKETDSFANTMGKTIPLSFRDSMVSAMRELSNPNSTEPLKKRLLGVAASFLQKINDGLMQNLANQMLKPIIGGFGSMTSGAGMPGAPYASGGIIKGGSGSKDDVPAMLMGGEYVLTKSAVKKYGPSFLDALNSGKIQKFAQGGWVESDVTKYQDPNTIIPYGNIRDQGLSFDESGKVIGMDSYTGRAEDKQYALMKAQSNYYAQNAQTGQGGFFAPGQNGQGSIMGMKNLFAFATQQTTGTQYDKISASGNAASIDIAGGSSNLSLFALRDQENLRNTQYSEAKQKALELYLGGFDAAKEKANIEEEARKEIERIKQEQKTAFRKQYQGMLVQLGISAAMALGSAALDRMSSSGGQAAQKAKIDSINQGTANADFSQGYDYNGQLYSSSNPATIENTRLTTGEKFFGFGGQGGFFRGSVFKSGNNMLANNQGIYSWDGGGYSKMNPTDMQWSRMKYGSKPIQIGNQTYYSAATRRASGGFVTGNGMGDNVPTMLNGGEFVISKQAAQNIGGAKLQQLNSTSPSDGNISEVLDSKLTELIDKLNAVGTINITVNSDSKGGKQENENYTDENAKNREMARKIKEVVLNILKEEKRLGGVLR